ncbi:MAG: hypothetical protein LBI31_05010, partial [Zoogloeaceae bacterium]|nr:hypothetical protein [Zoogloeaceae bacterium]
PSPKIHPKCPISAGTSPSNSPGSCSWTKYIILITDKLLVRRFAHVLVWALEMMSRRARKIPACGKCRGGFIPLYGGVAEGRGGQGGLSRREFTGGGKSHLLLKWL